ncbi:hypothetical protein PPYR_07736 [Photinus pyralis]|uniref:Pickpocket protein 28 n=2 Tax=Photinus pyralis TaxID=7054 RepID=A0A5N4ARC9_PHOPY|nr:pickpocket protein 28-like [Photinus pyralis]KAB0799856.1 hypothetical protein PPYR_07736 [Photinus pyralis]
MTVRSFIRNFKNYVTHYCSNASIHGLKFLAEKDRSILERLWWLVFLTFAIFLCASSVLTTHAKWLNSPVIVSFATSETPIYQIPFPAITICPLNKIESEQLSINATGAETMKYASLICPKAMRYVYEYAETVDEGALDFLLNISSDFEKDVWHCNMKQEYCNYDDYPNFVPTLSTDGVCFSFNSLDRSDLFTSETDLDYYDRLGIPHQPNSSWSTRYGYHLSAPLITYPRRAIATGASGGLNLILHSLKAKFDDLCGGVLDGYKIVIHHPSESPQYDQRYFLLPQNELVSVAVKPKMLRTSPEIQKYAAKDRKCFLDYERQLRFFKVYDQQNCLSECLTNYSYAKCDCVGFYMPHSRGTPICGPGSAECLRTAKNEFFIADSELQLENYKKEVSLRMDSMSGVPRERKQFRKVAKPKCNCLPSCHSLSYDVETSQIKWNWHNDFKYSGETINSTTSGISRLRVYFKDWQFMSSERNELYGESEFWANCGGLFGLFFGFSLMSVIEIVYYATLRLCCNIRKFGFGGWSGAETKEAKFSK